MFGYSSARLRTACDECHTAKVRCTGEKDGCKRCLTHQHPCKYSVSRVGKVVYDRHMTKRARPRTEVDETPSTVASNLLDETENVQHSPARIVEDQNINWGDLVQRQDQEFSILSGDIDSFLNHEDLTFDLPTPIASTGQLSFSPNQLSCAFSNPELESVGSTAAGMSVPRTTGDSVAHEPIDRLDDLPAQSKYCVLACTHLIDQLDAKLQEDSYSLDKIMCVCRESIRKLAEIRAAYEPPNSASCPPLMFTAMNQIVTLLEKGTQPGMARAGAINAKARVSYGSFEVDSDDQNFLGAQIIRCELKRAQEAVSELHDLLQRQEERKRDCRIYRQWSGDLTTRLEAAIQWLRRD